MSKLTKNERIDRLVACLRTQGIKMRELETRLSTQEKWSDYADNMLTELNHALPDPKYDAKCEAQEADVEASLNRHRERLGLNKPQLKQLDQSVFDNMHERWKFAAVDEDGSAHRFSKEVFPYREGFCYEGDDYHEFKFSLIGTGYDASNWQNSLIERDKVELTGSDLCRAMLERGDRVVLCAVGTPESVNNGSYYRAITEFRLADNTFTDDGRDIHLKDVTPINNQGEPLTASEVGL